MAMRITVLLLGSQPRGGPAAQSVYGAALAGVGVGGYLARRGTTRSADRIRTGSSARLNRARSRRRGCRTAIGRRAVPSGNRTRGKSQEGLLQGFSGDRCCSPVGVISSSRAEACARQRIRRLSRVAGRLPGPLRSRRFNTSQPREITMSSTEAQSDTARGTVDMKLEVVVIPISDVDRAKTVLRRASGGGSTPTARRRRLPGRPLHAAGLAVLDPSSGPGSRGRAGVRAGPPPDRLRHRGGAGCARRARASMRARSSTTPGAASTASTETRGRAAQIRNGAATRRSRLQRPGRQRLAAPGDHHAAARARRPGDDDFTSAPDLARALAGRRPPTANTRSASVAAPTGPTGTPRTWSQSRPARSCRDNHPT